MNRINLNIYLVEFLGSFLVILFLLGSILINSIENYGIFGISICSGISYFIVFISFSRYKPLLSPAMVFMHFLVNKIGAFESILRIISQFAGSIIAGIILLLISGSNFKYTLASPNPIFINLTDLGNDYLIVIIEFLCAFILTFFYYFIKPKKNKIYISGLIIILITFFSYKLTGAAFNPLRVLICDILTFNFSYILHYLLSTFAGTICGGISALYILKYTEKIYEN